MITYQRKTRRGSIPAANIRQATDDVLVHKKSIRSVGNAYGIHRNTLTRHVQRAKRDSSLGRIGYAKHLVFNEQEDRQLEMYLKEAANIYFGLTAKDARQLAYRCAKAYNVKMPESWERDECAGPDWLSAFLKRHPTLSIRTPEAQAWREPLGSTRTTSTRSSLSCIP